MNNQTDTAATEVLTPQPSGSGPKLPRSKELEKWGTREAEDKWLAVLAKRAKIRRRRALSKSGVLGATKKPNGDLFKFGDIREDGYRFIEYDKSLGEILRAKWASPDAWNRLKDRQKDYQRGNRAALAKRERERMAANPLYALRKRMRVAVQAAPNRGCFATSEIKDILGCTPEELKAHLEQQFEEGMTWENRGEWYVGYKIPQASGFTREEVLRLNRYTNLVPRWTKHGSRLFSTAKA
jgi:hypothetical protein